MYSKKSALLAALIGSVYTATGTQYCLNDVSCFSNSTVCAYFDPTDSTKAGQDVYGSSCIASTSCGTTFIINQTDTTTTPATVTSYNYTYNCPSTKSTTCTYTAASGTTPASDSCTTTYASATYGQTFACGKVLTGKMVNSTSYQSCQATDGKTVATQSGNNTISFVPLSAGDCTSDKSCTNQLCGRIVEKTITVGTTSNTTSWDASDLCMDSAFCGATGLNTNGLVTDYLYCTTANNTYCSANANCTTTDADYCCSQQTSNSSDTWFYNQYCSLTSTNATHNSTKFNTVSVDYSWFCPANENTGLWKSASALASVFLAVVTIY